MFVSADTVDPDWTDPQGLNRYAYCRNNPLIYTDPTGNYWEQTDGGFQEFIGPSEQQFSNRDETLDRIAFNHDITDNFIGNGLLDYVDFSYNENYGWTYRAQVANWGFARRVDSMGRLIDYELTTNYDLNEALSEAVTNAKNNLASIFGVTRVTNPKHHPNSKSPEPKNAQDLYKNSIEDSNGVRWAKDSNGTIHRFSAPSNGETHWNGSTTGVKPIRIEDIPIEIRRALK